MQVQANEVLDKMSTKMGLLIKEISILEVHNDELIKEIQRLNKITESLTTELEQLKKPPEQSNT